MEERIQKIIANSGICSRRKAEEMIISGKVFVNGRKASIGEKADISKDTILVDGKKVGNPKKAYYLLNKPKETVVTKSDPQKRKTIFELDSVAKLGVDVIAVGRLDMMSEGLILLTNDGDFANRVMHPRYGVDKVYYIRAEPAIRDEDTRRLEEGMEIDGEMTSRAKVERISKNEITIRLHEGKNRIIRRMMDQLGYKVYCLRRIAIGGISISGLNPGEARALEKHEVELFK
jgi:23S rRNA pseudouridine2605 synthase